MYEISSYGRVRRFDTKRILSSSLSPNGYYRINLITDEIIKGNEHKRNAFSVHVLVFVHFCNKDDVKTYITENKLERKYVVNHKDADKTNNHYMNLELMTYSENNLHAVKMGKLKNGENNGMACEWITNEIVEKICQLLEEDTPTYIITEKLKLPYTDYTKHLISKLYNGTGNWDFIANKYSFRYKKKYRRGKRYTKDFIREICEYIENGYKNFEISEIILSKYDLPNSEYNRIKGLASFIRTKQRYTEISKDYTF